jgi:hypothetical protein
VSRGLANIRRDVSHGHARLANIRQAVLRGLARLADTRRVVLRGLARLAITQFGEFFEKNVTRLDTFARESREFGASGHCLCRTQDSLEVKVMKVPEVLQLKEKNK